MHRPWRVALAAAVLSVACKTDEPIEHPVAADIQKISDRSCATSSCHDGTAEPDLRGDVHGAMVDVVAEDVELPLVDPGNRGTSYLWAKLVGTQKDVGGEGAKMPLTGVLTDAERETIGNWIDDGAPP